MQFGMKWPDVQITRQRYRELIFPLSYCVCVCVLFLKNYLQFYNNQILYRALLTCKSF